MKLFAGRTLRRFTEPVNESSGNGTATATEVVTNAGEADLVTSEARGAFRRTYHKPVIDLDVRASLVPSATPGHSHLYVDVPITWEKYERLLEALVDCGIVEPGYLGASKERGFTAVRVPWRPKGVTS